MKITFTIEGSNVSTVYEGVADDPQKRWEALQELGAALPYIVMAEKAGTTGAAIPYHNIETETGIMTQVNMKTLAESMQPDISQEFYFKLKHAQAATD